MIANDLCVTVSPEGTLPGTATQETATAAIIQGLQRIGYTGPLLQRDYAFSDWFADQEERRLPAAAFAQAPISYESACIGVVLSNGVRERSLVNGYRALGAPILLEVDRDEIREWAVSLTIDRHALLARYRHDQVSSLINRRAPEWKPEEFFRTKNIGTSDTTRQRSLFAGVLPELEHQIQEQLDPLLNQTLTATRAAYVDSTGKDDADPEQLFKLVFWLLTAKVFHDRRHDSFATLGPDADTLLEAVAKHYKKPQPRLLNRAAREQAVASIWDDLDFRNLSVEVLSQIWSRTLVTKETRRRLGIHRTSRTIVRYIVDRIPLSTSDDSRIVFEPCSGSGAFLVGTMQRLRRDSIHLSSAQERHRYFVKHLAGLEYDHFGVEISILALTLADFPNPDGWRIEHRDAFKVGAMTDALRQSAAVLCNPPFEDFDAAEKKQYQPAFGMKPAEVLRLVLEDLHPEGVIGFVLPRVAVDGKRYKPVREMLANRFASIHMTVLPDRAFKEADAEVTLLIATDPIPHDTTRLTFRRVRDNAFDWTEFERNHVVSLDETIEIDQAKAREGLSVPDLRGVWAHLSDNPTMSDVATIGRGLEWHRADSCIRNSETPGFMPGVAPQTPFDAFQVPPLKYLSVRPQDQRRNQWRSPWHKPKAILNRTTRSRGPWRIAAFADRVGIACVQTYYGVWGKTPNYDEVVLAAILNSPVANAFVASREGKTDNTIEVLNLIPVPIFSPRQLDDLRSAVERYEAAIEETVLAGPDDGRETLLKEIDALVLDGYRLPARLERDVLDFFGDEERAVSHPFTRYFPRDFESYFSLSDFLDPKFRAANVGELLRIAAK